MGSEVSYFSTMQAPAGDAKADGGARREQLCADCRFQRVGEEHGELREEE